MVINKHDDNQDDVEITTEDLDTREPELEDIELTDKNIIKSLKDKLKALETEKRELLEETQRSKADFLNARRRLDEDRVRDKERFTIKHIETLIPLCDSFELAMSNEAAWQSVDATWRKGVEGMFAQLQNIIATYKVKTISPQNELFNPHEHEAIGTVAVTTEDKHDKVITVAQKGYSLDLPDNSTEIIRPARVIIGVYTE